MTPKSFKRREKKARMTKLRLREFAWLEKHSREHLKILPADSTAVSTFDFGNQFGIAVTCYKGTEQRRHAVRVMPRARNRRGGLGILLLMERKLHGWVLQRGYTYQKGA